MRRSYRNHNTSLLKRKILRLFNCIDLPCRRAQIYLETLNEWISILGTNVQSDGKKKFVSSRCFTLTCFVETLLSVVVSDISTCQCNPSPDYTVVHSHTLGHLQCASMMNVGNLPWLHRRNYNYYYYFDYYCCVIASTALMLYWIIPGSLFAILAPFR